jgi:hypothetical protein
MLFHPLIDNATEVLAIRKAAKEALAQGLTVMSWSSEGSSATMIREVSVQTLLNETKLFLQIYDPDTYGRPCKVVKGVFS